MKKTYFIVLLMLSVSTADASGIAQFKGLDDGKAYRFGFEYLTQTTSRLNLDTDAEGNSYLLFKGDQVQVVTHYQGNTLVLDLESMNQMAQNFGALSLPGIDSDSLSVQVLSIKPTNSKEKIAGFNGDVYDIVWTRNGAKHQDEVVLSRSSLAWQYTSTWIHSLEMISKSSSSIEIKGDELMEKIKKEQLGLLRFGDRLTLVQASSQLINPDRFIAPDVSFTIPSLGDLLGNL